MSGNAGNKKRQYMNHQRGRGGGGGGGPNKTGKNPPRGSPGILLTCEKGREGKCKREGLEILKHYYYKSISSLSSSPMNDEDAKNGAKHENNVTDDTNKDPSSGDKGSNSSMTDKKQLTLEEEIAMLQKGASSEQVLMDQPNNDSNNKQKGGWRKGPFTVYSTGVNGTVFVMCTLPNSRLIPQIKTEYDAEQNKKREASASAGSVAGDKRTIDQVEGETNNQDEPSAKKSLQKPENTATEAKEEEKEEVSYKWDPLETMKEIVVCSSDTKNNDAPSSRYVSRMIPIQATCYTSLEEIKLTSKALIEKYLMPHSTTSATTSTDADTTEPPLTFAITLKRRACGNVTREEIIKVVGDEVSTMKHGGSRWKVDLSNPKFTILIEICKTICGMSIIENYQSFAKFNVSAADSTTDD